MSAHVVLIDALNLIRRIYAVQERPFLFNGELAPNTQQQVLHNTVQACFQALQNILAQLEPSHALVVFDSEKPCFRYALYPDYKKGRAKMPSHLAQQMNKIQDSFLALGVDSLEPDEDEADDVIATLSVKVALRNQHTTIVSTDKAFLSIINENIKVYDYFNRRYLDEIYVKDKFQVTPDKLLDLWTLTGDTTNKIPGVAGIGQVTAAQLLDEYGSLAAVKNAPQLKPAIKRKLEENQSQMELSRKLLTLKQDIPLGFNLKDIRLNLAQA
ncbi:flap endonuclease Xni [Thalassotalea eurytherma]|uniref:Flap endonuclease Xni n=1 Tax=Thalassotalea eurytherma TaxID=1144278 RepID=A0ABQ6GYX7_9GAMM|nr:flap endonuclease Xni [Thalassotalea eurytherma]GLX81161.1 Flap endonuclease Xni [Thalassotalea eurytherma]